MKKIVVATQAIILALFFAILSRNLWFEEILILVVLLVLISLLVGAVVGLVLRIFKKSNTRKILGFSLIGASVLQLVLCLFVVWSLYPRVFSREQVLSDIDHGLTLMEEIHPDLYARVDKAQLAAHVDSLKSALPAEVSNTETLRAFASITHQIGDAHTEMVIDNFAKRGSIMFRGVPPYLFRLENDKIHIQKNYYFRNNIPVGSEVISINNKPAAQCLSEVRQLISFETTAYRDAWLQIPIFWGMWNNFEDYEITYLTPDNKTETVSTTSGLIANMRYVWEYTAGYGFRNYSYQTLPGNIGCIDFQSFADIEKFKTFTHNTFSKIKKDGVEDLIIDIRRNSGGRSDVSEEMMQYLSPMAYATFDTSQIKISDFLISELTPESRAYVDSLGFGPGSLMTEDFSLIPLRENPLRFSGRCYVLTGGFSFSSALDFSAMVKHYNAGQIVGGETGGRTVSFGSPIMVTMPQTGVMLQVSFKRFVNAGGEPSPRGLIPDHEVANSIEDDIDGIDRVLEYTTALIRNQRP